MDFSHSLGREERSWWLTNNRRSCPVWRESGVLDGIVILRFGYWAVSYHPKSKILSRYWIVNLHAFRSEIAATSCKRHLWANSVLLTSVELLDVRYGWSAFSCTALPGWVRCLWILNCSHQLPVNSHMALVAVIQSTTISLTCHLTDRLWRKPTHLLTTFYRALYIQQMYVSTLTVGTYTSKNTNEYPSRLPYKLLFLLSILPTHCCETVSR